MSVTGYDSGSAAAVRATIGVQDFVRGDGTTNGFDPVAGAKLTAAGALATATYKYAIATGGASAIDVTLTLTFTTTTPTAKIYATFIDGVTQKGTSQSFATFVGGTAQTVSLTGLRGERYVVLEVTVPASSTATFSQAEYAAL